MNHRRILTALLILTALTALGTLGCSDSPTDNGSAPVISQLHVTTAIRVSGNQGVVGLTFQYADPDADLDRVVFQAAGRNSATNGLNDAGQSTGEASIQQAVTLPAAGTQVDFTVYVLDRNNHRSNVLTGSFVAPS